MLKTLMSSRTVPALVLALALGILGGAVLAGYRHLERVVRAHLVDRDGEILYAVAQARQLEKANTNLARLSSRAERFILALELSQLRNDVLGVRLFDADGRFKDALPPNMTAPALDATARAHLRQLRPLSRYHQAADLQDYFLLALPPAATASNLLPLLEINIPIHPPGQTNLVACAQLLVDGSSLAAQTAAFGRQLRAEAWGVFLAGAALLSAILVWAYRRLQKTHRLLQLRTEHLLRANHELTLAAKTGALGAVAAHLVHGLSNPLASLQLFMYARGNDHAGDTEWEGAVAATERMRQMVHEVVRVLGEQQTQENYEISLAELVELLQAKARPAAQDFGVQWEARLQAQGQLSNHQANLILLILENLVSNALQVTPRGKCVRAVFAQSQAAVSCQVADEGPGIPDAALKNLFVPCRSTKGGAGLGLAISKHLADHLGAKLDLIRTGPRGCVMELSLPVAMFSSATVSEATASTLV